MFDEKWMKGAKDKPIESPEDVLMVLMATRFCGVGGCENCAIHMYDHSNGKCGATTCDATNFLLDLYKEKRGFDLSKEKNIKKQQAVYEMLFEDNLLRQAPVQPEPERACNKCRKYQKNYLGTGLAYCDHFHNFVHDDGFCYLFEPVIME